MSARACTVAVGGSNIYCCSWGKQHGFDEPLTCII